MTDHAIYEQLRPIFDDVFDAGDVALAAGTTADDVDGWDSLNHVRLMLAVQKRFNVKFAAHEIGALENVGELVALIRRKLPQAHA
ncbi:acyl carrier protein [Paraburkholderia caballeronis]|uniref:Acyl carrier protein n=1 Tax=Paraburkholderia caballeronis TaxID=416943 RepID=A0A1H7JVK3_9BURK|nr:acyl carrier protein [Paraburkholderia caballeronis]PXW27250.1 acyl carrier protein [Paraburkholderia caballeronis]PXX02724.1 acyl carrier protein [Paraburkholderia caballeronis]RAK03449.1 acyl carrier protein [Paraburkholderia caballeronis]TDV17112.1 acyl carrier protein [Paraburkholderia caballeronis]TDV17497.1 acyl carrier protein [Paraburkholderia caballeronis]